MVRWREGGDGDGDGGGGVLVGTAAVSRDRRPPAALRQPDPGQPHFKIHLRASF